MQKTPILTIGLLVLALASLAAAVTLEILGDDSQKAWAAFGGLLTFFAGVHVKSPTDGP